MEEKNRERCFLVCSDFVWSSGNLFFNSLSSFYSKQRIFVAENVSRGFLMRWCLTWKLSTEKDLSQINM